MKSNTQEIVCTTDPLLDIKQFAARLHELKMSGRDIENILREARQKSNRMIQIMKTIIRGLRGLKRVQKNYVNNCSFILSTSL